MQRKTAEYICTELLYCAGKLDQSVGHLAGVVDPTFLRRYRRLVGEIMGAFYDEMLKDIFNEYPDLEPDSMNRKDDKKTRP